MKTVVAVLRGGPSREYDISLKSGAAVLQALDPERYAARDIFIDKRGQWHRGGMPALPAAALQGTEVAFNVLHGEYGEDGTVQRILDTLGVPYTGSNAFASATAFNKHAAKQAVRALGIDGVKVPHGRIVSREEVGNDLEHYALALFRSFPMPVIIKPLTGGSSLGISLAVDFDSLALSLAQALATAPSVLVEELIRGKEATVGIVEQFRGEKHYALLPVEIIPPKDAQFFDYRSKYSGEAIERCPGHFNSIEKENLMESARRIHEGLGLSHYSRSDFILTNRGIYFLEINSAAGCGLTTESLLPKSLHAVGSSLPHFLEHVIELARRDAGRRP